MYMCISIISLWQIMRPVGHRDTVVWIFKEEYYTLLYESSGPCDFREEDFFFF